ncbi:hypothetical protein [Lentzea sp. NPDC059081]|uniref:hypothetical protein n=1 Tax=Lentzea sp. NPDC059081 TaxID=3346719 RepID=UPI0036CC8466
MAGLGWRVARAVTELGRRVRWPGWAAGVGGGCGGRAGMVAASSWLGLRVR